MARTYHVYCQVPFCKRRCPYCCFVYAFPENELTDLSLIDSYVNALIEEINNNEFPECQLDSIVFGGGTPSLITVTHARSVLEAIHKKVNSFSSVRWISMEATPDSVTLEKMTGFREAGINRLSIGIQSFFSEELVLLGRTNTVPQAHEAICNARKAGFDALNLDLMFGFPGNTFERFSRSFDLALEHSPENISIYANTFSFFQSESYLTKMKERGIEAPGKEEKVAMFRYAVEKLITSGYEQVNAFLYSKPNYVFDYEIDVFTISRNILGFGPFSVSYCSDGSYLGHPFIKEYIKKPGDKYFQSSYQENLFKYIMGNITHNGIVERKQTESMFNTQLEDLINCDQPSKSATELLISKGYASLDDKGLWVKNEVLTDAVIELWDLNEQLYTRSD